MVTLIHKVLFGVHSHDGLARSIDSNSQIPYLEELARHYACEDDPCTCMVGWETSGGLAQAWGLLKEPEVAVCRSELEAGTVFHFHQHDAAEWLLVYVGEIEIQYPEGGGAILAPGDSIRFGAGRPHRVVARTDVKLIAVTIPADEGFPDAPG